jgi:adenylyltransferase/sulfurtransferase
LQCKSGARSARALKDVAGGGIWEVANVEGGILAWAEQIDTSMPKY